MPTSWGLGPLKITSVDVSEKNRSTVQKGVSCQQRFFYVSCHAYAMHPVFSWYFMARFENSRAAFVLQQSVVLGWEHDVCSLRRLAERVGNWWRMPEFENQPPNLFLIFCSSVTFENMMMRTRSIFWLMLECQKWIPDASAARFPVELLAHLVPNFLATVLAEGIRRTKKNWKTENVPYLEDHLIQ